MNKINIKPKEGLKREFQSLLRKGIDFYVEQFAHFEDHDKTDEKLLYAIHFYRAVIVYAYDRWGLITSANLKRSLLKELDQLENHLAEEYWPKPLKMSSKFPGFYLMLKRLKPLTRDSNNVIVKLNLYYVAKLYKMIVDNKHHLLLPNK